MPRTVTQETPLLHYKCGCELETALRGYALALALVRANREMCQGHLVADAMIRSVRGLFK